LRPLPVTALPPDAGSEIALTEPSAAASAASAVAASPAAVVTPPVPASGPAVVAARASAPAAAGSVKTAATPPRAAASAAVAAARPSTSTNDGARAAALLSGAASAPASSGRFVVQVGAYTDARTLKEARGKVEKLGLQTYTQVVENDAGKRTRVRLGPYATRDEAEAAAAKLKRAGLPANILAL
jgi:DedD protein